MPKCDPAAIDFSDEGQLIPVTASFGIAISKPELRPQQLLSQADQALYQAKAGGRNQVKSYLEPLKFNRPDIFGLVHFKACTRKALK